MYLNHFTLPEDVLYIDSHIFVQIHVLSRRKTMPTGIFNFQCFLFASLSPAVHQFTNQHLMNKVTQKSSMFVLDMSKNPQWRIFENTNPANRSSSKQFQAHVWKFKCHLFNASLIFLSSSLLHMCFSFFQLILLFPVVEVLPHPLVVQIMSHLLGSSHHFPASHSHRHKAVVCSLFATQLAHCHIVSKFPIWDPHTDQALHFSLENYPDPLSSLLKELHSQSRQNSSSLSQPFKVCNWVRKHVLIGLHHCTENFGAANFGLGDFQQCVLFLFSKNCFWNFCNLNLGKLKLEKTDLIEVSLCLNSSDPIVHCVLCQVQWTLLKMMRSFQAKSLNCSCGLSSFPLLSRSAYYNWPFCVSSIPNWKATHQK